MFEGARRAAIIFMAAVLAPSIILECFAFRALRDQQIVLETQKEKVCLSEAENIANLLRARLATLPEVLDTLATRYRKEIGPGEEFASGFDAWLIREWPLANVGFLVRKSGTLLSPTLPSNNLLAQPFCTDNGAFFQNKTVTEAYVYNSLSSNVGNRFNVGQNVADQNQNLNQNAIWGLPQQQQQLQIPTKAAKGRNVKPYGKLGSTIENTDEGTLLLSTEGSFASIVGDARNGTLARFVNDRLQLLVWNQFYDTGLIAGAELNIERVANELAQELRVVSPDKTVCFALLDDRANVRASTASDFTPPDWRKPLVSVELGETLPHWEVAGYLRDPKAIPRGVRTIRWMLGGLIVVLAGVIAAGGWLILSDVRRQVQLARQRTDFVSNVSHELKTPLTSIRMFSEMLMDGRVSDSGKQHQYLTLIGTEARRLIRLIDNVLDFAKLERKEAHYNKSRFDLLELLEEQVHTFVQPAAEMSSNIQIRSPDSPLPVFADRDAIAQIIINLLSNAEKYAQLNSLRIDLQKQDGTVLIRFHDSGPGITAGMEEKIFERFFRAQDSLSSGSAGTGIGLTLSRQLARDHGGELRCVPCEAGACFELTLPLAEAETG